MDGPGSLCEPVGAELSCWWGPRAARRCHATSFQGCDRGLGRPGEQRPPCAQDKWKASRVLEGGLRLSLCLPEASAVRPLVMRWGRALSEQGAQTPPSASPPGPMVSCPHTMGLEGEQRQQGNKH